MKKININREVVIVSLLLFILAGPMFGPVPQYLLETLKLFVRETSGWLLGTYGLGRHEKNRASC